MPKLPKNILQNLKCKIKTEGCFTDEGDYLEGEEKEISFEGALLPLTERDMRYLEDGEYSIEDMKLYTDDEILNLKSNTIIELEDGTTYKIYAPRRYNIIDCFKRYFLKKIENVNA